MTRPPPPVGKTVQAQDGSRYPLAAAWCIDLLPRRVREGEPGEKTYGYVDRSFGMFVSGLDGTWTTFIQRRLDDLRFGKPAVIRIVRAHVEMKVATMMIQEGRRSVQLVINHVPCGSQFGQRTGCHQVLEAYLPEEYALTVLGTTQQGEPFAKTYRGRA